MAKGKKTISEQLKESWFIILFIGGLVVSWTNVNSRLASVEAKQAIGEDRDVLTANAIATISVNLAKFETTLNYIKEQVEK